MGRELSTPPPPFLAIQSVRATPLFPSTPLSSQLLTALPTQRHLPNPFTINSLRTLFLTTEGVPPSRPSAPHSRHLARKTSNFPSSIPIPFNNLQNALRATLLISTRSILMGGVPPSSKSPSLHYGDLPLCAEWYTLPRISGSAPTGTHEG